MISQHSELGEILTFTGRHSSKPLDFKRFDSIEGVGYSVNIADELLNNLRLLEEYLARRCRSRRRRRRRTRGSRQAEPRLRRRLFSSRERRVIVVEYR